TSVANRHLTQTRSRNAAPRDPRQRRRRGRPRGLGLGRALRPRRGTGRVDPCRQYGRGGNPNRSRAARRAGDLLAPPRLEGRGQLAVAVAATPALRGFQNLRSVSRGCAVVTLGASGDAPFFRLPRVLSGAAAAGRAPAQYVCRRTSNFSCCGISLLFSV